MEENRPDPLIGDDELFVRMTPTDRLQHIMLIASFSLIILTGFPLLLHDVKVFKWILSTKTSHIVRGALHRAGAVGLVLTIAWHMVTTVFTPAGRKNFRELIPRPRDIRDAVQIFGHNLGLTRFLQRRGVLTKFFRKHRFWLFDQPPLVGRYNFIEKFEYWAVAWGSAVMILTGFFMWFENLSLRFFPLWVHNVFIVIHDYESILAFLSILIWHMYNVHLNPDVFPMSKVWLNGLITGKELRLHHPLEYRQILQARINRPDQALQPPPIVPADGGPEKNPEEKRA